MIISPAYAQAAGVSDGGFATLLPLVLIFVVFYFLLIRPQQKRAKNHRNMLAAVVRGDKIVTGGGIIGTVTKVVNDEELALEAVRDVVFAPARVAHRAEVHQLLDLLHLPALVLVQERHLPEPVPQSTQNTFV